MALFTYFGYALLICVGHIRDFFNRIFKKEHTPVKVRPPAGAGAPRAAQRSRPRT